MKNTKTTKVKGESDKSSDKCKSIGKLPLNSGDVLSVDVLQMCGRTNLRHLLACAQSALKTDTENCQKCHESHGDCKVVCHETRLEIKTALENYSQNLQEALEPTKDDFPLLPDLRAADWLDTKQPIVAYSVCANAARGKWLERTLATNPKLVDNKDGSADIEFSVEGPHSHQWCLNGDCAYDLHSPYMMTLAEEIFFSTHLDVFALWLSMCGNLYPEFKVCDDVKNVFVQTLSKLHEAAAV